jgi:hypothetical protein
MQRDLTHVRLFENWEPEISSESQMRKAAAKNLLTLPQTYIKYIKDDRYPGFKELMYLIWKNLTHEDRSKHQKLEDLGLFNPADITAEQLIQLPGMNDIVKVFDTTNGGKSSEEYNSLVNKIFPGLIIYANDYDSRINWNQIERVELLDNGKTDITLVKGYISGAEGPDGEIPILVLNEHYVEAWMNINDL